MLILLYMSSLLSLISSTSHGQGCSNAVFRLLDNSSVSYELCVSEFWDTIYFSDAICGNNWSLKNSLVVCKQLGYQDVWTHTKFRHPQYVQRSGVSVRCNGTENDISDCGVTVDHNCTSVSVGCRRNQFINASDVQLVNAYSDTVGDVEIFFNGSWMPLCYHNINQARVDHVCRRLGWDSGKIVKPPITEGVRCVGWTCDDVGCLRQYLTPDSAARVECQQYDANNTMNVEVSLSDDGVPLVIHEGRQTRVCVSDHVLNGGDDCENTSSLPMAICQHLGYNAAEIKTKNSNPDTQQLPMLMAGKSNCTICPPSLPQKPFLNEFTMCLPNGIEACNTSIDFVLICTNTNEEEHHGFGVGAIIGIIVGVLLVILFLSPFIGSSIRSCYKNCIKSWFKSDRASTHPTATTNPGASKVSESKGGHSLALSTSEAEPSTYESSTLTKTHSNAGAPKDPPPNYDETLKCPKQSDSTL